MYQGKLPLMISNLDIVSPDEFHIYKDQVYYSHDGLFIFFFIVNRKGYIEKAVIVKSDYLHMPDTHEYILSHHMIKASDIESDPALLWGH